MTTDAAIEKAKAVIEEMRELLAKLEAEKATKARNWPERIEAGMVFRHEPTQMVVLWTHERMEDCVVLARGGGIGDAIKKEYLRVYRNCEYLGHARDIITIRTDAHEPTGAELVGRVCEVMGVKAGRPATAWSPTLGVTWADDDMIQSGAAAWHKDARLAK